MFGIYITGGCVMSHHIRAFLGHRYNVLPLAKKWSNEYIQLPQGVCMLFLTDSMFDNITESINIDSTQSDDGFIFLTPAIKHVLEEYSKDNGKLAYIETDYHGGAGSQSAVLFENGKKTVCNPMSPQHRVKLTRCWAGDVAKSVKSVIILHKNSDAVVGATVLGRPRSPDLC